MASDMTRSPTPATRAELVEVMARALDGKTWPWSKVEEAEAMLAAIEARGVIPCPAAPTQEMINTFADPRGRHIYDSLRAFLAASPYRKEQRE